MNKKGFTFIELIAIILILGAICLVSFPTIINMAKQSDKNTYEEYKETVCLAAKTYINNEKNDLAGKNYIYINYQDLIDLGYVQDDLNELKSKLKTTENSVNLKIIFNEDKTLECVFDEVE